MFRHGRWLHAITQPTLLDICWSTNITMLNILLPKYVEINFEPLSLRDIKISFLFILPKIIRKKCSVNSNGIYIGTFLESNFFINNQFIGTISITQKLWMIIDDGRTIIKSCKFLPVILCLKKTKLFLYPIYWFSDCQLKWWWLWCLHK